MAKATTDTKNNVVLNPNENAGDVNNANPDKAQGTKTTNQNPNEDKNTGDTNNANGRTPKVEKNLPVYTVSQLQQMPIEKMREIEKLVYAWKAKVVKG